MLGFNGFKRATCGSIDHIISNYLGSVVHKRTKRGTIVFRHANPPLGRKTDGEGRYGGHYED
jgi:hypothetical protein